MNTDQKEVVARCLSDSDSPGSEDAHCPVSAGPSVQQQVTERLRVVMLAVPYWDKDTMWLRARAAALCALCRYTDPPTLAQIAWLVEDLSYLHLRQRTDWDTRRAWFRELLCSAKSYAQVAKAVTELPACISAETQQQSDRQQQQAHNSPLWLPKAGQHVAFLRRAYTEHLVRARPPASMSPAALPDHWRPLERCCVAEVTYTHTDQSYAAEESSHGEGAAHATESSSVAWLLLQRAPLEGDLAGAVEAEDGNDWRNFSIQRGFPGCISEMRSGQGIEEHESAEHPCSPASSQDTEMQLHKAATVSSPEAVI